jgi:hypothetical protein
MLKTKFITKFAPPVPNVAVAFSYFEAPGLKLDPEKKSILELS